MSVVELKPEDLPDDWRLLEPLGFEVMATLERHTVGDLHEMVHTDESGEELLNVWWAQIEHSDGQRATIRTAPKDGGYTVTAALVNAAKGGGLQRQELLSVPVGSIARALSARSAQERDERMKLWARGFDNLGKKLPPFENSDAFYKRVAMHWKAAFYLGDPSPTDRVAEASDGASKSTAQRWVAQARKRGFIQPGLTGKPGRRSS